MERNKVIILQESVTKSLIKEVATFLLFAGLLLFNHEYLGGSLLIDMTFIVIVLLWLYGAQSKHVFKGTKEQAIKWLKEQ